MGPFFPVSGECSLPGPMLVCPTSVKTIWESRINVEKPPVSWREDQWGRELRPLPLNHKSISVHSCARGLPGPDSAHALRVCDVVRKIQALEQRPNQIPRPPGKWLPGWDQDLEGTMPRS